MSSTAENDAEDVNDFLKRIQELGTKRDQEDEERNRKLEEEILQGRKERQARRAERVRSISPTKDSPVGTPTAAERNEHSRYTNSPTPDLQPTPDILARDEVLHLDMDHPGAERSPSKENVSALIGSERTHGEKDNQKAALTKGSPSSAMPPSRSSTLSWQRRPNSQGPDHPRSRPLSMIAAENAARSPRATPEPSFPADGQTPASRDQIAQMLSSKDPTWFRQTADRGENSPAFRKTQVEDIDVVDVVSSSRVQMPGMSHESVRYSGSVDSSSTDMDRSTSPSRKSSNVESAERSLLPSTGRLPLTNAPRLDPPTDPDIEDAIGSHRSLAMSPSQGRISPERMERSTSPTKGMGGFVQSAMMKRSDSVSKRWSVQSPPGLSRGNSVTSNRDSAEPTSTQYVGGLVSRESHRSSVSRDNSPLPHSRPTSSHSNATLVQDRERFGTSSSMKSSMTESTTNDGFMKPTLPNNKPQLSPDVRDLDTGVAEAYRTKSTPPSSPSRVSDTKRWSPTKSSWLESALNKSESPKPKLAPLPPQQPAWMSEINKVKQKSNTESARSPPAPKHEVNIGGLLRSPPPGGLAKPPNIVGFPVGAPSGSTARKNSTTDDVIAANKTGEFVPSQSPSNKVKPETPPKKDFRANLKSRQLPLDASSKEEPEFKNVFGQLRRTKVQNYVAPDELKDNILRGKAGLNATGGPKKTERTDEFKEAILKKKDDFKKAQLDATGVTRSASGNSQKQASPVPEALAKKATLGKVNIGTNQSVSLDDADVDIQASSMKEQPMPTLHKEMSAPGRLQGKEAAGGKLSGRFNPALANLLARGPPSVASDASRTSSPVTSQRTTSTSSPKTYPEDPDSGPQLTHMTKTRARGPRRRVPSKLSTGNQPNQGTELADETRPMLPEASLRSGTKREDVLSSKEDQTAFIRPLSKDDSENEDPQSPMTRKLYMEKHSEKKATFSKLPAIEQELKSKTSERKLTPTTKPKPSVLSSSASASMIEQTIISKSSETPLDTPIKVKPVALSLPQSKTQPSPLIQLTNKTSVVETAEDSDSVLSVKSGAALFGDQAARNEIRPPGGAKPPIKLPTQADENAAMVGAGLRSSDQDSSHEATVIPPSHHIPPLSSIEVDNDSTGVKLMLPQKANGMTAASGKPPRPPPNGSSGASVALPPVVGIKPSSPRKVLNQPVPQSSEASRLLNDFFGKNDFVPNPRIDTAAILSAKPDDPIKIKTLRSQLFQLSGDGKKQQVPTHQERILFENNMYICPHTFGTLAGKKVVEVYFWAGDGVAESSIEDTIIFAQREAKTAGGKLIKLRQGHETSEFIEALGGIMIIRRGSSNKYDSLSPHILCGRCFAGQIVFDEVDFSPSSLCSGFPYLISTQSGTCYLWKGKGSGVDELSCARLIGMDFGLTGELEEIEDSNEPESFLKVFGNEARIFKSADHWRLKPNYPKYSARLFCADPASKTQITELHPFSQASLSPSQIYILDAFFEIYVIVGSASQAQYTAFCTALLFAQEYGILAAGTEDRPFVPISTVVLEGVPRDLKACFRKWKEGQGPTTGGPLAGDRGLHRGKSLRVVPLNAALDASRF